MSKTRRGCFAPLKVLGLHGLTGDTAQLHFGANLTRHHRQVACTLQYESKKPSIARSNKLAARMGDVEAGVFLFPICSDA